MATYVGKHTVKFCARCSTYDGQNKLKPSIPSVQFFELPCLATFLCYIEKKKLKFNRTLKTSEWSHMSEGTCTINRIINRSVTHRLYLQVRNLYDFGTHTSRTTVVSLTISYCL